MLRCTQIRTRPRVGGVAPLRATRAEPRKPTPPPPRRRPSGRRWSVRQQGRRRRASSPSTSPPSPSRPSRRVLRFHGDGGRPRPASSQIRPRGGRIRDLGVRTCPLGPRSRGLVDCVAGAWWRLSRPLVGAPRPRVWPAPMPVHPAAAVGPGPPSVAGPAPPGGATRPGGRTVRPAELVPAHGVAGSAPSWPDLPLVVSACGSSSGCFSGKGWSGC
jgi:hypothetical protein